MLFNAFGLRVRLSHGHLCSFLWDSA